MKEWQKRALQLLDGIQTAVDRPMAEETSFKIGGPLDLLAVVTSERQLDRVLQFCRAENLPWFILGLGSNLLVRDGGIRGVGIKLLGEFAAWRQEAAAVTAGAGVVLGDLAKETADRGLSGLEFACGIPGSLGGAVFMNAGAYAGEMSQVLERVQAYDPERGFIWYEKEALRLGYRSSIFQESGQVIARAVLRLAAADRAAANAKVADLTCRRAAKQPLELPSAGSVFRRPAGYYVGTMIEEAGLKGYAVGGAQVSPKHAGFIVNTGDATARHVLDLIAHVQRVIWEKFNVRLETEIRVVGEG